MRIDKWLWAARFFKTRSLASDAVSGGRVKLNDSSTKPAREIRIGDCLEIWQGDVACTVTVRGLSEQRGPAPQARLLYEESAESIARREAARLDYHLRCDPAADIHGRPTKRDRRRIDRFGG